MTDTITFEDFCRIILTDWRWRRDGVAPALRDYKRHLLTLLGQEFGVTWDDDAEWHADAGGVSALALTMPRDFAGIASPFARWLEQRPQPGERAVLEQHQDAIIAAEGELKQRWLALFRDLLRLRWLKAGQRTTSWTRLRALGLGDPVDELDFF